MNLQTKKIELTKSLLDVDSEIILKHIEAVLASYKTDLWDDLSNEQKASVKKSISEYKKGKFRTHESVMKKYKKWLTK